MKCSDFLLPLIYLLFVVTPSAGQINQVKFSHISVEDGLSQSTVYATIQDHSGYLWFGTQDGLNRYDGYHFEVFRHDPTDSTSISHNWIWDVLEDHEHNIWLATWNGLNRYDSFTKTFRKYSPIVNDPGSISGERTNFLFQDSENRLWISAWGGGLNLYDYGADQFRQFKSDSTDPRSINNNYIRCIIEDSKKTLWIGTWGGGLNKFDPVTNTFDAFLHDPDDVHSISSNFITSIGEDKNGRLWIGTHKSGLNRFDPDKNQFDKHFRKQNKDGSLSDNNITIVFKDDRNRLWIGTQNGGLHLLNIKNKTFRKFGSELQNPKSLSGNNIFSIFQDRGGIIWIGATGLSRFDPKLNQFIHINPISINKKTPNSAIVRCFFEDGNNIWVGTDGGGINIFSRGHQGFTPLRNDPDNTNSLSSNNVRAIIKDRNDHIWIATLDGGLNRYNPATKKFDRFYENANYPQIAGIGHIETLYYDSRDILWIGTGSDGLFNYQHAENKFEKITTPFLDTLRLNDQYISTIYEDSRNIIWVGHWGGGLSALYPGEDYRIRFNCGLNDKKLSNDIVHSIWENESGVLWIGTASGLDRFIPPAHAENYDTVQLKSYHIKDGLPNEVVYGILGDESGHLWLSTNNGLSKFYPSTQVFKNYTVDDGLQGNEFNAGAFLKDNQGNMYFGGNNGFNIFHPDSILENGHIPPIVITSFRIFDQLIKPTNPGQLMELSYDENFISFEFAALDYTAPDKNHYAYMMDGLDQRWQYSGNRRFASYTNLDPGKYTFKVKGSNNDGVWNEEGFSMQLYIHPPFWRTWWFMLIVLITISAVILSLHEYRVRQLLEVEKIRVKIASDLHDDVGSSLTKISMFSDLIIEQTNPAQNKEMLSRIELYKP